MTNKATVRHVIGDVDIAREICGEHGGHLKVVEREARVQISSRGNTLKITGPSPSTDLAVRVLTELEDLLAAGYRDGLDATDLAHAIRLRRQDPHSHLREYLGDTILTSTRGRAITPRSVAQKRYVDAIRAHDIVFAIGPAGTGKTYLAMAMAMAAYQRGEVIRVVLARPAVEAGEKLGFLPGDLQEKVNPYLRPLYDALHDMMDLSRASKLLERGVIEVAPLAFMRGRTLNDSFVILDEAQNTTHEQMKMFLTRLGIGSKAVVTGDITQIDLPREKTSGLVEAAGLLADIEEIAFVRFTERDVVRHNLVQAIIRAYDVASKRERDGGTA
jgi:phosphate starvation-inducible PhoH-like protein